GQGSVVAADAHSVLGKRLEEERHGLGAVGVRQLLVPDQAEKVVPLHSAGRDKPPEGRAAAYGRLGRCRSKKGGVKIGDRPLSEGLLQRVPTEQAVEIADGALGLRRRWVG